MLTALFSQRKLRVIENGLRNLCTREMSILMSNQIRISLHMARISGNLTLFFFHLHQNKMKDNIYNAPISKTLN